MTIDPRWEGRSIPYKHWHFHRRLHERYGIIMAPGEFGAMVKAIKSGKALMVHRKGKHHRIYWHKVQSVHERIYVLVGKSGAILSAWPPTKQLADYRKQAQARRDADRRRTAVAANVEHLGIDPPLQN